MRYLTPVQFLTVRTRRLVDLHITRDRQVEAIIKANQAGIGHIGVKSGVFIGSICAILH